MYFIQNSLLKWSCFNIPFSLYLCFVKHKIQQPKSAGLNIVPHIVLLEYSLLFHVISNDYLKAKLVLSFILADHFFLLIKFCKSMNFIKNVIQINLISLHPSI